MTDRNGRSPFVQSPRRQIGMPRMLRRFVFRSAFRIRGPVRFARHDRRVDVVGNSAQILQVVIDKRHGTRRALRRGFAAVAGPRIAGRAPKDLGPAPNEGRGAAELYADFLGSAGGLS